MSYPSAPWTLQGYAIQTLQLTDVERVRPFIPPEFEIVSVLPGKTLGGVYLSYYGSDSVLQYSELIIAAGIVRYGNKLGGWISHIYVDNPNSVAGGREIWGLPKELANFTWTKESRNASEYDNYVTVHQGEQMLCQLSYNPKSFGLQLPFSSDVFSTQLDSILSFNGKIEANVGLCGSRLQIPIESPFASLGLDRPWLTFYCENLHLVAGTPKVVGHREAAFSYR
jgi:hypothetical protein